MLTKVVVSWSVLAACLVGFLAYEAAQERNRGSIQAEMDRILKEGRKIESIKTAIVSKACVVYDEPDGVHIVATDPVFGDLCEVILPKGIRAGAKKLPP